MNLYINFKEDLHQSTNENHPLHLCDLCYKVQRVLIPDGLQQIVVNPDIDKEQTHSVINSTLSTQIKLQLILHLLLLKGPPYVA